MKAVCDNNACEGRAYGSWMPRVRGRWDVVWAWGDACEMWIRQASQVKQGVTLTLGQGHESASLAARLKVDFERRRSITRGFP